MTAEPTPHEIMRRLDEVARQMSDLTAQIRELNQAAAATYVRQDVYLAQRQAEQAVVADLHGDLEAVRSDLRNTEDKRRTNVRWAVGVSLSVAGLVITMLALVLNQGGPI